MQSPLYPSLTTEKICRSIKSRKASSFVAEINVSKRVDSKNGGSEVLLKQVLFFLKVKMLNVRVSSSM